MNAPAGTGSTKKYLSVAAVGATGTIQRPPGREGKGALQLFAIACQHPTDSGSTLAVAEKSRLHKSLRINDEFP
jgi:hypothetical protein